MEPTTIAAIGSALGGIGQLASGLGLGGSKGTSMRKQIEWALNYDHRAPSMKVYGAKKAGLHPLYVMGTGGSFSPSVSVGRGQDYGEVGLGLQQAIQALAGKKGDPVQAEMETLGLRQANAETLRSEYATEMAYIDLQREKQKGMANAEQNIPPKPGRIGVKAGDPLPLWIEVVDREGKKHDILNPELGFEQSEVVSTILQAGGPFKRSPFQSTPRSGKWRQTRRGRRRALK